MNAVWEHRGMQHPTQRELWSSIYPNARPSADIPLPHCAKRLKVFVYNLPASWNADLLQTMEPVSYTHLTLPTKA